MYHALQKYVYINSNSKKSIYGRAYVNDIISNAHLHLILQIATSWKPHKHATDHSSEINTEVDLSIALTFRMKYINTTIGSQACATPARPYGAYKSHWKQVTWHNICRL